MRYIVEDNQRDEVTIEDQEDAVMLSITIAGEDPAYALLSPAAVKEIQFALQRSRESTEKKIQAREGARR